MTLGYDHPLYLLPFDHRHSYESAMFGFHPPLTTEQHQVVVQSKRLIYDGFCRALDRVPVDKAAILVDEEFGADVLRDARLAGYVTAVSLETSGSDAFELEYGAASAEHLAAVRPTFAKVLVRYNPEGDAALNRRQTERLKQVSDRCRAEGPPLLFELLVPATEGQLARVDGEAAVYDHELRPTLMVRAIAALQDAGIEPDVWKVEGLDRRTDCERIVEVARRQGRERVGCVVLGRGADEDQVVRWLETAASVSGFIGFAVGRTTFWDPVAAWRADPAVREASITRIADRYARWSAIFEGRGA